MNLRAVAILIWLLTSAEIVDPPELGTGPDRGCERMSEAQSGAELRAGQPARVDLAPDACLAHLDQAGVSYRRIALDEVATAIEVDSIGGVAIEGQLDCRLASAILEWAPELRARGIVALLPMSIYRANAVVAGTDHISGHAHALALDLGAIRLADGREIDVLNGWVEREHGADPCTSGDLADPLRGAVCAAIASDLFQVVLTPHHDAAHSNHVHLEVRPDVSWTFVR